MAGAKQKAVLITQGTFDVSDDVDVQICTLLGSCVASCLWDPTAQVGGMNHLLLAMDKTPGVRKADLAGVADMEQLINGIIKLGGRRDRLMAKVFGGAQMLRSGNAIGQSNIDFVLNYLQQENIPCVNSSVGGTSARAIKFWPHSGRASMRLVDKVVLEPSTPAVAAGGNGVELL